MRNLLCVMLVACGGGSTSAPPPVSNKPAAAPPPATPVAAITRPTCTTNDQKCTVATMEYFSTTMCACADKPCVARVNQELSEWGLDLARRGPSTQQPDPDLTTHAGEVMNKYTACMSKVMGAPDDPPPPDPCGG